MTSIQSVIFLCDNLIFMIIVKSQKDTKTNSRTDFNGCEQKVHSYEKKTARKRTTRIPESKFSCFLFKAHSVVRSFGEFHMDAYEVRGEQSATFIK